MSSIFSTILLSSVLQDLKNLNILSEMIKKVDNPKPIMLPLNEEDFGDYFPEYVVTSQFIEAVITLPLDISNERSGDFLRAMKPFVLVPNMSRTISLMEYAVGDLTNTYIQNQDIDNLNKYLEDLVSPMDFKTPLIIDLDDCILDGRSVKGVVVIRPYLKQLFELLGLMSE